MLYAEFGVTVYPTRASHHIHVHHRHYEEWSNVRFIRRVSYDHVVWC